MLNATGHRKVQTDTMKAYRKHNRKQYNYHQCQLGRVTTGNALLISVCLLMLPMVQLSAEKATTYHVNPINQCYVHGHRVNISHTPLVLPSLGNVLPAIVLQNSVVRLNISCPSYASSCSSIHHIPPSLHLNLLSDLGRSAVGVVLALLLLLSGDIETNPGPVGQGDLKSLHSDLHPVADKWYSLGVQLQVPIETLKCIRRENLPMTECLLEMLTVWLKCTTPPPTWNILTEALESPPVGERLLAQKLRDKYCRRTEERVTHGYPSEGPSSVGHSTPQGSYPQCASPYSMPPQPHPSNLPPWSARYYSPPPTSYPMSTQLFPPPSSGTAHAATPPTVYSQVTPDPTPALSSYIPTPVTASPPYPVLPPSLPFLISDSTSPDTPPTPQAPAMTPPPEHTVLLDRLSVEQQVKQFEDLFIELIDCTYDILVEKGVDVHRLHSRLISLDVSRKHEHQAFINNHLMNIDEGTNFNNLWARLGSYWNFLNFDLLEHVINKFGSEILKQKMESYKHDLQSFRKATRLCDFMKCWPVLGETPPETELREFVAKMKRDWDNCTLEDLEKLKGAITRKFFLPEFALLLKQIKEGCVVITWFLPEPFLKALQETIQSTSSEFFIKHKIETIFIDGQEYNSTKKIHLEELSSAPLIRITPPNPSETLIPVEPDLSEEKAFTLSHLMTRLPTHLPDTLPSSDYLGSGNVSRQSSSGSGYSPRDFHYASTTSSSGYSCYSKPPPLLESLTTSDEYVRERYVDETSEHVKLLPSVEQYLSKAEVEADPSLPTKFKDYLSSTPAIRAALYTTFNAKMAAEVFSWNQHTKSLPPTTMTELFTAFTLKTLVDHLSTHPVHHKLQLKVTTFSDLPTDVYKQFQALCRMANEGILNRQQLVFSAAHLPSEFSPLDLMQEVPLLYTEGRASSYHFIHFTLQEYLAAIHISQLPAHNQTRLVQKHLDCGHFQMTIRFLAGLTKLANISPDITRRLMENDDTKLHCLFEAKDISVTTTTHGSDEIVVYSRYSWTPLDYYVTGRAIIYSNCPWTLKFGYSSIDDDKFELFCQGCAAPGGTGCRGYISHANVSDSDITSKSIRSFVNIPQNILKNMRALYLYNNKLDGSACDLLAKAVPSMIRLEELSLSNNPLGSGGAVEVIKALGGSGVKVLWLYNTGIGEPDCEALCQLLKSSNSPQRLDIDQNDLSSESVASIITGLSHNSSLTTLDISNSNFSMANVVSLAPMLRDQSKCTLTVLALQDCNISGQGASELAAGLCYNSSLKYLKMDCNPIGVMVASSMSDMLQHNTSLEELNLGDDSLGEEGVHQLINSLKHNQTLNKLYLPKKYKSETSDHRIFWWC